MYKKYIITLVLLGLQSTQGAVRQRPWDHLYISLEALVAKYKKAFGNKEFLVGVALAEHQQSGATNCPFSNWTQFETMAQQNGTPYIHNGQRSGVACDFWNRYPQDIELMCELGISSCRISIDWAQVEPVASMWQQDAIDHYVDLCNRLIAKGIKPMVTLHHFVHPLWFKELGGFEHEENIFYFTRFCKKVFLALGSRVSLWCTINEPSVHALQGYLRGAHPPAKKNLRLVGEVLKNLMIAHCQVYTELKALPGGSEAQIGLVHSYLPFDTYHDGVISSMGRKIFEKISADFMNTIFNESIINFLHTGVFKITIPFTCNAHWKAPATGKQYLDFLGLNYYSRVLTRCHPTELLNALKEMRAVNPEKFITSSHYDDEVKTDMPYAMYPQGIYDALMHLNTLNVPLYVTENGIADARDVNRDTFIRRYIWSVLQAAEDGCDVRGYFYWTLMDNFEWNDGFSMKFGLYSVDFDTQQRTLRDGAKIYQSFAHAVRNLNKK